MENENYYFKEWESRTFGSGYGSGELPIMRALKRFFGLLENDHSYDHQVLEKELGETVAWLLINALDKGHVLEWGTSARYGWLTSSGEYLRDFIKKHTAEELYEIVMTDYDALCMCDGEMKEPGHELCGKNPFWDERLADSMKYAR